MKNEIIIYSLVAKFIDGFSGYMTFCCLVIWKERNACIFDISTQGRLLTIFKWKC